MSFEVLLEKMKLKLKGVSFSKENKSSTKGWRGIPLLRHSGLRAFLVFLTMSFAFWFLQSLQNDVVRRLHIPLAYDTLSVSLGISEQIPEYLELEVQDKALEHMRYALEGLDTIRLSISQQDGREFIGISANRLREAINKRLSGTAQILQQSTSEIHVALYKRKSKKLPVRLAHEIKAEAGFVAYTPVLTPDSLVVYGEERLLNGLTEILLPNSEQERYRENTLLLLQPNLPAGIHTTTSEIQVEIEAEELTEQSFILPILVLNQPKHYKLTPLPGTVSVSLTLPRSMYNELKIEDLEVAIDYSMVVPYQGKDTSGATSQLPVLLTRHPAWVVGHRMQPEMVQYILESL